MSHNAIKTGVEAGERRGAEAASTAGTGRQEPATSAPGSGGWPWRRRARRAPWPIFYLAPAVALLAARLAGPGSPVAGLFPSTPASNEEALLDSFSEPAVACSVLKTEALRLWMGYWEALARGSELQPGGAPGLSEGRGEVARPESGSAGSGSGSGLQARAIRPLVALEERVEDLARDLSLDLMVVELENHEWDRALDRYLSLVYQEPEREAAPVWAWTALDCARMCGRIEEAKAAIRHAIRVRQQLGRAGALEVALDSWEKKHPTPEIRVTMR